MTWPFSRRTTYVASSTPSIKAADLNALQDAIVELYGFPPLFGSGDDGALSSASGTTTLFGNMEYTTVNLSGTALLVPASNIVRASEYIQLRGTSAISADGGSAANNSATAGTAGGAATSTLGMGAAGGNGGVGPAGNGSAGGDITNGRGGNGGLGGAGGGGTLGGAAGSNTLSGALDTRALIALLTGFAFGYDGSAFGAAQIQGGCGGGGGGAEGGGGGNDGLGGGGGGGVLVLCAPVIDIGSGCGIFARGGNGASNTGAPGDFGGGGAGGGGGYIVLVCSQLIETGTISVDGGDGGTSSGFTSGADGNPGTIVRRVLFP